MVEMRLREACNFSEVPIGEAGPKSSPDRIASAVFLSLECATLEGKELAQHQKQCSSKCLWASRHMAQLTQEPAQCDSELIEEGGGWVEFPSGWPY